MPAIVTVDYASFVPVLGGKRVVDWEKDMIRPLWGMVDVMNAQGLPLVVFVDYCELMKMSPSVLGEVKDQLKKIVGSGHEVQLCLHCEWIGAEYQDGGVWNPGPFNTFYGVDLDELVRHGKECLENITGKPVLAYRAGGYKTRPLDKLCSALSSQGILFDSSFFSPWGVVHRLRQDVFEVPMWGGSQGERWDYSGKWDAPLAYNRLYRPLHKNWKKDDTIVAIGCTRQESRVNRLVDIITKLDMGCTTFGELERWSRGGGL